MPEGRPETGTDLTGSLAEAPNGSGHGAAADTDIDLSHPSVVAEVARKRRAMRAPPSRAEPGLPRGQARARRWIVLDLGLRPSPGTFAIERDLWRLRVTGPGGEAMLSLLDIEALGVIRRDAHWHCVTGWSALGLAFDGVPLARLLAMPAVAAVSGGGWTWLEQRSADGYAVPVARADAEDADNFFAVGLEGAPLPMEHGGPRLVLPKLYGWKSAKWLCELRFATAYPPGFWERLGCHARGRVAHEERFAAGWTAWLWGLLAGAPGLYRRLFGHDVWVWVMQAGGAALGAAISRWLPGLHTAANSEGTQPVPSRQEGAHTKEA